MSSASDKVSAVIKGDTTQGYAERCKQNEVSLKEADEYFKKELEKR